MNKRSPATIATSAVIGVVITLASGLFRTPFERVGVDVVQSGLPIVWSMRVIPRPIHIVWSGLVVDIVFWALIGLVAASTMACLGRTRTTQPLTSPRH